MLRLAWICLITVGLACSSSGSTGGDGSALGGSGGGNADGAGDTGADPCSAPLSQNTVCASSFAMQVTSNPCDPDMATQATCGGHYQLWSLIVVGSEACVYDTSNNGKLVGARSCGGAPDCPQGCIDFGIAASQYATCGAETPACPP
jgi:hypothetical protein